MSPHSEQVLKKRISKLLAQNNRLREVIESFSSRFQLQRENASPTPSADRIDVFEEFSPDRSFRPRIQRSSFSPSRDHTIVQNERWFPAIKIVRPLDPSPGWRNLSVQKAPIRIGFNLVGLSSERTKEAVTRVERRQLRDRDFVPVFITDLSDFEVFRLRGYVFEYIPQSISRAQKNQRAERSYLRRRLDLIKAKWNLRELVDLSK